MKKTIKLLLLAVLVVCTVCALAVIANAEETVVDIDSGYVRMYKDDKTTPVPEAERTATELTWKVQDITVDGVKDRVLTIEGEDTTLYYSSSAAWDKMGAATIPWYNYIGKVSESSPAENKITKVVIKAPITKISQSCAFNQMFHVRTFVTPDTTITMASSLSMPFANMNALTTFGPEGTPEGTIDLRNFVHTGSQAWENSAVGKTVRVLLPYHGATPISPARLFSTTTVATFVVLPGSPSDTFVNGALLTATNKDIKNENITVEYYEDLVIEGANEDGYTTWTFDYDSGLLTFSRTDKPNWGQFNVHNASYQAFTKEWGNDVKDVVFANKFDKIYYQNGTATKAVFQGMANLETVTFAKGQRIQNSSSSWQGIFQGCTSLKAVTFGGTLVDGVVDFSGAYVDVQDNAAGWLGHVLDGCTSVKKVILPTQEAFKNISATAFVGCTALEEVVIPANVQTIEEGTFDAWTNNTDGYANLTVTFPLDSELGATFESAGKLTIVAPKTELVTGGQVDQTEDNENDLVWSYDGNTKTLTISGTSTSIVWVDGKTSGWNGNLYGQGKGGVDTSMIPWYAQYAKEIENVVITAPITTTPASMFYQNHALKSVTFPESCKSLGGMTFADCKNLETLKTAGATSPDGVIDLRNFTGTCNSQVFETAPKNGATLWLPRTGSFNLNNVFGRTGDTYNFVVYPGSIGEEVVYGMQTAPSARVYGTFNYTYYTEEQAPEWYAEYMATTSYAQGTAGDKTYKVTYNFDIEEGKVTIVNKNWDKTLGTNEWRTMLGTWKYAIKTIVINGDSKLSGDSNGAGAIYRLPNLETFICDISRWQNSVLLYGNKKLTTVGTTKNVAKGVVNLSTFSDFNGGTKILDSMFEGDIAITNVVLPATTSFPTTAIGAKAFGGCTALQSITIPATCVIETVDATAFEGLTEPVVIYNEADNEITAQALLAALPAGSYIHEEAASSGEGLESVVVFDGWKVRTTSYNGLRGVFYSETATIDANEANGWVLQEYGALLATTAKKNALGATVKYDVNTNTVSADGHVRTYPIYSTNESVDLAKTLGGSDVENPDNTYFAVSVVKYNSNYTTEVYMAGYEVWTKDGQVVIMYTAYDNDATYTDTSIYEVSLGMYKAGFMNAKVDANNIVWDSLVAGGAVVLTKGTHYVTEDEYTDGAAIDMKTGKPFGDTFTVANVPMVWQSVKTLPFGGDEADVRKTLTYGDAGVTYTMLNDCFNSGKYVLVYRDDPEVNGTMIPETSPWGGGYKSQISTNWYPGTASKGIKAAAAERPNPKYKTNIYGNCATAIIDYGVTGVQSEGFTENGSATYMYHETFTSIASGAWQSCGNVKSIYPAGTTPVVGFADLSPITNIGSTYVFNGTSQITEIHMPDSSKANVKSLDTQFAQNSPIKTLWFGDGERVEGVLNFSNTNITTIGAQAFTATTATEVWLPATVTSINDVTNDKGTYLGAFTAATLTIRQAAEVESIATYCEGKGYTYLDLNGNAFVALEESQGWSGIIVK